MWGLYRRLFGLEINNSPKTRGDLLLLSVHPRFMYCTHVLSVCLFMTDLYFLNKDQISLNLPLVQSCSFPLQKWCDNLKYTALNQEPVSIIYYTRPWSNHIIFPVIYRKISYKLALYNRLSHLLLTLLYIGDLCNFMKSNISRFNRKIYFNSAV